MRLGHRDFAALQQTILELHEFRDLDSFRAAVPSILLQIIPAEAFTWPQWGLDEVAKRPVLLDCVASDPLCHTRMLQVPPVSLLDHPFYAYFVKSGDPTALKISDFLPLCEFRETALYYEFHRHLGIDRELSGTVLARRGPGPATLSFGRRGRDFTERDRLILNLVRPHFNQAHRNADLYSARRAAGGKPLSAYKLSPRETEVASWLAQGKTNPEIAVILQLSARTVEKHVERILQKVGVENRAAAAVTIAGANGN